MVWEVPCQCGRSSLVQRGGPLSRGALSRPHPRLSIHSRGAPLHAETQRKFSDFLSFEQPSGQPASSPGTSNAAELVDRATSVLEAARQALETVRQREPADSRNRRSGPEILVFEPQEAQREQGQARQQAQQPATAATAKPAAAARAAAAASTSRPSAAARGEVEASRSSGRQPTAGSSYGRGDYDEDEDDYLPGGGAGAPPLSPGFGAGGRGGLGRVDSWFAAKVDTGPMAVTQHSMQPMVARERPAVASVAVLDRPAAPQMLAFGAPAEQAQQAQQELPSVFPASLQLRFETELQREQQAAAEAAAAAEAEAAAEVAPSEPAPAPEGEWETRSGEEKGPNGYWYRWTEARGRDAAGQVQWCERWWEASDWFGMRELGAEKWGANANGDAWRETWREALNIESNGQPWVERSAHKWAKNVQGNEWEEKWGEQYWSGGKVDKWADKWAREGGDIWHEKWGEMYDGHGGCTKYTDKWAEREHVGGGQEQWGDKWEETFKGGRGEKKGETWSVGADGRRFNRWWGENHYGEGWVQKFGHSTEGEHWDTTEQSGTYYNCNPHFTYKMAVSHSPVLHGVPLLPREGPAAVPLAGGAGNGNGDGGLGPGFGALG